MLWPGCITQPMCHFSAAFQCCGDKQWGDWRPHLAVILSNQGGDPELYQRTIVAMGDTLGKQRPAPSPPRLCLQASFKHPVLRLRFRVGPESMSQAFL